MLPPFFFGVFRLISRRPGTTPRFRVVNRTRSFVPRRARISSRKSVMQLRARSFASIHCPSRRAQRGSTRLGSARSRSRRLLRRDSGRYRCTRCTAWQGRGEGERDRRQSLQPRRHTTMRCCERAPSRTDRSSFSVAIYSQSIRCSNSTLPIILSQSQIWYVPVAYLTRRC